MSLSTNNKRESFYIKRNKFIESASILAADAYCSSIVLYPKIAPIPIRNYFFCYFEEKLSKNRFKKNFK